MEKKEIRRVKGEDLNCRKFAPLALKGQKLLAQGTRPG